MNNDTPADAIKPCPFCGGECELQEVWGYWKVLGAHLRGCPFHCHGPSTFGTRDSAIAAWNTRTTSLAAQDSWQPLSQDDAETELLSCLKNMKVAGDDKCLIDEMRWRGLWVYRKTGTKPSPLAAQDGLVEALRDEGQFLLDRIDQLDWSLEPDDFAREWNGHVEPPLARFRAALASIEVKSS